jgi:hypothetical protein
MIVLLPVLIPAAITAFHALAELRRRRKHSRVVLDGVEPIRATA